MTGLSTSASEHLRSIGVDLRLLAALVDAEAIMRVNDEAFTIPCERPDGSTASYFWAVDREPTPWSGDEAPATWWPVGRNGSTAIVVVGAEDGLVLASTLFCVAEGVIRRRPNLPGVLSDAVPVVLPETHAEIAVEWICSDMAPAQLISELVTEDFDLAFLAMVVEAPSDLLYAELPTETFIDACALVGAELGITVVPVPLPSGVRLGDAIQFRGHGRRYALAGLLEYWRLAALHPPTVEGDE